MKHHVLLVQRGVIAQVHPVSGKSMKSYGNATQDPSFGGVVFQMTMEQYAESAYDLIGNLVAGQQWVPLFVQDPASATAPMCSSPHCVYGGGRRKAAASYEALGAYFCSGHAPKNAHPIIPAAPPIGTIPSTFEGDNAGQIPVAPPQPVIEKPVITDGLAPASHDSPAFRDPGEPIEEAVAPVTATTNGPTLDPLPEWAKDEPSKPAASPDAAQTKIKEFIVDTVKEQLVGLEDRLGDALIAAVKAATPGRRERRKKAPSSWNDLQRRARAAGIAVNGRTRAAIEADMASSEAEPNGAVGAT